MSFSQELWNYRSALSAFCCSLDDLTDAFAKLRQSELDTNRPLSDLRSYIRSGSGQIIIDGRRISAVGANNTTPAYLSAEASLVTLMHAATEYLERKSLVPDDDSKFRTMDLSFSLSVSMVEGDVDTSRREIRKHFSSIEEAHKTVFNAINNTPVLPRGLNSVALNNLEMAFSKNMKDPFWLSRSSQEPFPDLLSLSWPSPDRSQDPVSAIMRRCCQKWAGKEDALEALTNKTLEALKSSFCQADAAIKELKIEEDAEGPVNTVAKKLSVTKDLLETQEKRRAEPVRVAIIGCMSHGKSSFINSLIGQQLVISQAKASTSIPMVVEHVKDLQHCPTLHIVPNIFSEYLQTLREMRGQPGFDLQLASEIRNEMLDKRQRDNLRMFEQEGWNFKAEYTGESAIIEAQQQIIDLIRFCGEFASASSPKPVGKEWPRLCVHMVEMAKLDQPFQIVDLPGYGDVSLAKDPALLEQLYKDVFLKVDGVILVTALLDEHTNVQSLSVVDFGRSGKGQPPLLLAIGTKIDEQKPYTWNEKSDMATCKRIFKSIKTPRLVKASPAIHIQGMYAQKYLDSAPKDFMKTTTLETLEETDLYTYRLFQRLFAFATPATTREEDQIAFSKLDFNSIREKVQRMTKAAGYDAIHDKLNTYVVDGVKKRRCLAHMVEAHAHIEQAQEAEAVALRTSYGRETVRKAIEEQRKEFSEQTTTICEEWKAVKLVNMRQEAIVIMNAALSLAEAKARSSLETIVEQRFPQFALPDSYSKFQDRDKAIDFLYAVEKSLRESLNCIQRDAVRTIRTQANTTWSTSLEDLRARVNRALVDNDQSIFRQLKLDLDHDLAELSADSIVIQVRKKIEEALTSKTPSLPRFRAKEKAQGLMQGMPALRSMEKWYAKTAKLLGQKAEQSSGGPLLPPLPRKASSAADSQGQNQVPANVTNSPPVTAEEQEISNRSINDVGFLIRAPASASAVQSSITQEFWPWINDAPDIEIALDAAHVVKQYASRVLPQWAVVLKQECQRSIEGAINLSMERGELCVKRVMEKKKEDLSQTQGSSKRPFSDETLEKLVLFRANAISTREIAYIVGEKLRSHIKSPDVASGYDLPEFR